MKRMLSLVMAAAMTLSLLAVPAFAAGTSQKDYFTANGIEVMQDTPQDLQLTYVTYDPYTLESEFSNGGSFTVREVSVKPSSQKEYQTVYIEAEAYLPSLNPKLNSCMMGHSIYDYYTGRQFPRKGTVGDTVEQYTSSLDYNGRRYVVKYTQTVNWTDDIDSNGVHLGDFAILTWTFEVPKGYNGLTFALGTMTEPPEGGKIDTETLSSDAPYVYDSGDQLFRFGQNLSADTPMEGLDPQIDFKEILGEGFSGQVGQIEGVLDVGLEYNFSLVNNSGAPIQGYYALVNYSDLKEDGSHSGSYAGVFNPIDVDLAPDEVLTTTIVTTYYISRLKSAWIKFDSAAERDQFLAAPWLHYDEMADVYDISDPADQSSFTGWLSENGLI